MVRAVDFVGRVDPVRKLRGWLLGEGVPRPLGIVSISGPGGIGKTFLLDHALASSDVDERRYLRLRLGGTNVRRTLGQLVCRDLLQSCTQLDATGKGYFAQTRRNHEALRAMDVAARAEVNAAVGQNVELRETVLELFRFGVGAQSVLPALKQYVDLSKIDEKKVEAVARLLEKARAYQQEKRALGGILPDLVGAGRRNRLRLGLEAALADGLVADLAAILSAYRLTDSTKPMPSKVPGLDRLLLVLDDYESLDTTLTTFLADHLVPRLARASFETLLVVLGRDRLSDTHAVWKQRHELRFAGELRLAPWSREEADTFVRSQGVTNEMAITRILDDTEGYPYLLAGEVEAERDGGGTALGLKNFYERTTRWMTPAQKAWLVPLSFLDEVNEETIARMLPGEDAARVLAWFKDEASVRSPSASRWEVLPILRSRICAYCKMDSPRRYRELEERARATTSTGVATRE
jgi:hypothetical protein